MNPQHPWRVAVAGCGAAAFGIHLPILAAHPAFEVIGVCDRDPRRARVAAHRFGIPLDRRGGLGPARGGRPARDPHRRARRTDRRGPDRRASTSSPRSPSPCVGAPARCGVGPTGGAAAGGRGDARLRPRPARDADRRSPTRRRAAGEGRRGRRDQPAAPCFPPGSPPTPSPTTRRSQRPTAWARSRCRRCRSCCGRATTC